MLKHMVELYKVWYMLGYDEKAMDRLFEVERNPKPFVGRTIYHEEKGWVGVLLNKDHLHDGPELMSVLSHELLHVVSYIFHHVRFWPETCDDMEPWCYLQENLMEVSLKHLGYE